MRHARLFVAACLLSGCGSPQGDTLQKEFAAAAARTGIRVAFGSVGRINILDPIHPSFYREIRVEDMLATYQSLPQRHQLLIFTPRGVRLVNLDNGGSQDLAFRPPSGAALSYDALWAGTIDVEADGDVVVRCGPLSENPLPEIYRYRGNSHPVLETLTWSPIERKMAFSANSKVFIYDAQERGLTHVAEGSFPAWSSNARYLSLRLPDGAVALAVTAPPWSQRRLDALRPLHAALWSPDDEYLLFSRSRLHLGSLLSGCMSTTDVALYRVRDGAISDIFPLCMGDEGRGFFWVIDGGGP